MAIKAITFDLWDTLIDDDSDEPKRKAQGLRSKYDERRHLVWEALNAIEPIDLETVRLAYATADAAFNTVWHDQHITWEIADRLSVVLRGLGRTLPDDVFAKIVKEHEEMEVNIPPDTIAGAKVALDDLAGRYKLCIVSDTIVSPGRCLRELLEVHGLKQYFSGFAFSDEVGHSKPHRTMFESAASQMGCDIPEMIHIGDRDHNDVKGPQALGMKAVLFIAKRANDKDTTSAEAICETHAELPATIDRVAGR
jgi:HAD superfamily hydrolase (TIGR01549 family)